MRPIPHPLSHAYLITGGREDSRLDYARQLTAAYLCQGAHPPCGVCLPCRKVAEGIHPDVIWVGVPKGKREITVDQARTLRSDAYIRPNEGVRKVYIIHPADSMNQVAQNALLKVLEEGPDYAAFLLVAEHPGRLLDTIRSRCEQLALPPQQAEADPQQVEQAAQLCRLLLTGSELEVAEGMAALERQKLKGGELLELLAVAERQVSSQLAHHPQRGVGVLRALRACRESSVYNPSPVGLMGQLCAQIFGN